jgi:hypothetical protein
METSNLFFVRENLMTDVCKMVVTGALPYFNIVFDVQRYIHAVTIVGNVYSDWVESKNWKLSIGNLTRD